MGREVGGGFKIGNMCTPWGIHVDLWQNQYNIVNLKKLKLKIKKFQKIITLIESKLLVKKKKIKFTSSSPRCWKSWRLYIHTFVFLKASVDSYRMGVKDVFRTNVMKEDLCRNVVNPVSWWYKVEVNINILRNV